MDPSETNSFEEQWKKAFQEASETPPLSAWEGIEAHLNKEERDVVPLWWQKPRLWYAAASVAALLMVGIGLWNGSYNSSEKQSSEIVAGKTETDRLRPDSSGQKVGENSVAKGKSSQENDAVAPDIEPNHDIASADTKRYKSTSSRKSGEVKRDDEELTAVESGKSAKQESLISTSSEGEIAAARYADKSKTSIFEDINVNRSVTSAEKITSIQEKTDASESMNPAYPDAASRIVAETLMPIGYKDLDVYVQKRYVFFKPNTITEKPVATPQKNREYYAAVGLMPASFNPNVKVTTAPSAFANANASRQSLSGNSHSGTSYAVQTQGGKRLSKHWSVETGLSYLQGNSSYEGGGYLLDAATSRSQNVLQSALMDKGSNSQYNMVGGPPSANALYIDLNNEVRNDYRYLQVPVQAGYTLNPDKKLSYSVLGGMMANFFMNNEIESPSGTVITTKASDDVYRSLNWAATTGLRFNYKLSSQWRATLTGSYQQSLTSGFKNNETLESHPYLYGVSWGVRYSF